jgi:hypothetical protein
MSLLPLIEIPLEDVKLLDSHGNEIPASHIPDTDGYLICSICDELFCYGRIWEHENGPICNRCLRLES